MSATSSSPQPQNEQFPLANIDKNEVLRKAKDGELISTPYPEARSPAWASFNRLFDKEGVYIGWALCNVCNEFVCRAGGRYGTTSLLSHRRVHDRFKTAAIGKPIDQSIDVPRSVKTGSGICAARWIAQSLRPLGIVGDAGLRHLLQRAIMIGSALGAVDVDAAFPTHREPIRRSMDILSDAVVEKIKGELCLVEKNGGSITVDGWRDDFIHQSYETVTVHVFDEDGTTLISQVLCTIPIPPGTKETGDYIRGAVERSLVQRYNFDISQLRSKLILITDEGGELIKGFADYTRLNCFAHEVNTALRHVFGLGCDGDGYSGDSMEPARSAISAVRNVVAYFKLSKAMRVLPKSVKTISKTRFNTHVLMLSSVHDQFSDVVCTLNNNNRSHLAAALDKDTIRLLVEFLGPIKEIGDSLEYSRRASLHNVWVSKEAILRMCEPKEADLPFLKRLKELCRSRFQQHLKIHDLHLVATFLEPRSKRRIINAGYLPRVKVRNLLFPI